MARSRAIASLVEEISVAGWNSGCDPPNNMIRLCTRCIYPDTKPDLFFDDEGGDRRGGSGRARQGLRPTDAVALHQRLSAGARGGEPAHYDRHAPRLRVQVGLSDHTLGTAVALGATAVEKHVTLFRTDGGPDSAFSLEPEAGRRRARCLGRARVANYLRTESESDSLVFRCSNFAADDIAECEALTNGNVRIIRTQPRSRTQAPARRPGLPRGSPHLDRLKTGPVDLRHLP